MILGRRPPLEVPPVQDHQIRFKRPPASHQLAGTLSGRPPYGVRDCRPRASLSFRWHTAALLRSGNLLALGPGAASFRQVARRP
jgi:hypothetical protein